MTYVNIDNLAPTYIQVVIDGTAYDMTKQNSTDNDYTDGCLYFYTTQLSSGTHDYHFKASDGIHTLREPALGQFIGPNVSAPPPIPGFNWIFTILGLIALIWMLSRWAQINPRLYYRKDNNGNDNVN